MKTQNTNFLTRLNSNELVSLTKEVKETIAVVTNKTTFSVADLWNIQRNRRTRVQRRMFA